MSDKRKKLSSAEMAGLLAQYRRNLSPITAAAPNTAAVSKPYPHSVKGDRGDAAGCSKEQVSFAALPAYQTIKLQIRAAEHTGVAKPYFMVHEGAGKAVTVSDGRELINFSTYDYLGLNADPRINAAAAKAAERYGTSAGASRLVAGERPVHRELEQALARFYHTEDAVVMVGGYATNATTIASLFGEGDVIFTDKLCHNSIMTGAKDSGALRVVYAHNDPEDLRRLLQRHRSGFSHVLIVTEGVFSMDGNIARLKEIAALKREFGCFLMVDEAHALGCIGSTGGGSREYFDLNSSDVDIWMGTLSKTLCSCGGFIAGSRELIELLKYKAPGFVYSVGLSPVLAAASLEALKLIEQEPWRTKKLQQNCSFALKRAAELGLDTGLADGTAVLPVIIGSSLCAAYLSNLLIEHGICVLPIIYPVVAEGQARLRFFISASHSTEQIDAALAATAALLPKAREREAFFKARAQDLKAETLQAAAGQEAH